MPTEAPLTIAALCYDAHRCAFDHGWWDGQLTRDGTAVASTLVEPTIPEKLCLMHSEISEALEVYRDPALDVRKRYTKVAGTHVPIDLAPTGSNFNGKPEGFLVELADVVIRIGDLVGALGLSEEFEAEVKRKMAYNEGRPERHGGKRA